MSLAAVLEESENSPTDAAGNTVLAELLRLLRKSASADKRFFTVASAAQYGDLSPKSIRRLLAAGKLTALRPVRGRVLIDRHELEQLILSSTASLRIGRGRRRGD